MTFYKVIFEHEGRRSPSSPYKAIESVDVHVEAEDATEAVTKAKQIFLYDHAAWKVRVIGLEGPGPDQGQIEP